MDQNGSQGDFASLIQWDAQGHHNSYLVERAKLTCYARFLSEWLWLRGRPMLTKYPILKHKHINQHYKEMQKLGLRVVLSGKRACKKEDFFFNLKILFLTEKLSRGKTEGILNDFPYLMR